MLSQALHAVCMVHVPQTHLLWAALGVRGRKPKQAGRQKCFLMYGMSHLSALATCPLLVDVILCLIQVSLGPFELVLECISVVNRDTEAECVFQLLDCLPISKT